LKVQKKALIQMRDRGELIEHTAMIEVRNVKDKGYHFEPRTFWKCREPCRCPDRLKRQHREFLLDKYDGYIPYRYEKFVPLDDLDEEDV